MLSSIITSKTRLRIFIKFFISSANYGYLNGLTNEFNKSNNSIRKELNNFSGEGYLQKPKIKIRSNLNFLLNQKLDSKSIILRKKIS